MNNKQPKAVWVFLDSEGKGLAVELNIGLDGRPMCPMCVRFTAYGIYDVTNDKYVKWKLPSRATPGSELMATIQLLAANPKGQWIRGRSRIADALVAAYTGEVKRQDADIMWMKIGLCDPQSGVLFPEYTPVLSQFILHPDDQEMVDAVLSKRLCLEQATA